MTCQEPKCVLLWVFVAVKHLLSYIVSFLKEVTWINDENWETQRLSSCFDPSPTPTPRGGHAAVPWFHQVNYASSLSKHELDWQRDEWNLVLGANRERESNYSALDYSWAENVHTPATWSETGRSWRFLSLVLNAAGWSSCWAAQRTLGLGNK